jgi:hypothetical protein
VHVLKRNRQAACDEVDECAMHAVVARAADRDTFVEEPTGPASLGSVELSSGPEASLSMTSKDLPSTTLIS